MSNESCNRHMSAHVIGNPVPTPEEMGEILGLSSDRVAAVRKIMSTPNHLEDIRPLRRSVQGSGTEENFPYPDVRPNCRKEQDITVAALVESQKLLGRRIEDGSQGSAGR